MYPWQANPGSTPVSLSRRHSPMHWHHRTNHSSWRNPLSGYRIKIEIAQTEESPGRRWKYFPIYIQIIDQKMIYFTAVSVSSTVYHLVSNENAAISITIRKFILNIGFFLCFLPSVRYKYMVFRRKPFNFCEALDLETSKIGTQLLAHFPQNNTEDTY